ncbi:hypothetical protein Efla_003364 [Eimeria flavescens]
MMASQQQRSADVFYGRADPISIESAQSRERREWDGDTRNLLERVGHLQSAPCGLLSRVDVGPRGKGETFLRGRCRYVDQGSEFVAEVFSGLTTLGGAKPTEPILKGSLKQTCSTPLFSREGSSEPKARRTSSTLGSTRKRKLTYDDASLDGKLQGKEADPKQQEARSTSLYSMLLHCVPKVTGVFFDKSQERWVSSVYIRGRNIRSYFPVYKHGFLQARDMAITQRMSEVAHKGLRQTELDALTSADLTVEALVEAQGDCCSANNRVAARRGKKGFLLGPEQQQDANTEQMKPHSLTSTRSASSVQQLTELVMKRNTESSGASIRPSSFPPPSPFTSSSLPAESVAADRGGNRAISLSPPPTQNLSDDLSLVFCHSSCLFASLHTCAALDFIPWEKGIAWKAELLAWTVQSSHSHEKELHVPVRLDEKHKENIEAVDELFSKAGDMKMRIKLALLLSLVGRYLVQRAKLGGESQSVEKHACAGETAGVNQDGVLPTEATEDRPHVGDTLGLWSPCQNAGGRVLGLLEELLTSAEVVKGVEAVGDRKKRSVGVEDDVAEPEALEGAARAAGAVFQAVVQAYGEAVVVLRRLGEAGSGDEMHSALEEAPKAADELKRQGEGEVDGVVQLMLEGRNGKDDECGVRGRVVVGGVALAESNMTKREFMTPDALALKPWPQGVSWASSSGRWFAFARLPSGSRVARTFHPSTKGGVKVAYRLACDFLQSIRDDSDSIQNEMLATNRHKPAVSQILTELRSKKGSVGSGYCPSAGNNKKNTHLSSGDGSQKMTHVLKRRVTPTSSVLQAHAEDREGLAAAHACGSGEAVTPDGTTGGPTSGSNSCQRVGIDSTPESANKCVVDDLELESLAADQSEKLQQSQKRLKKSAKVVQKGMISAESVKECSSMGTDLACLVLPPTSQSRTSAHEEEASTLSQQREAVRRCLLDLRGLTTVLFPPDIGKEKAATVDAHVALLSSSLDFQSVLVYVRLFELALHEGQLPSQMSAEAQTVYFGALNAIAESHILHTS